MPRLQRTPTYRSWEAMKARCNLPSNNRYKYYGAKGITYPAAWESFTGFLADMGERPEGTTLDRIDTAKNYSKENCRWADIETQNRNRSVPHHSSSGVKGVSWQASTQRWFASSKLKGRSYALYNGLDFFEAVCARKSWENKTYFSKES